MLAQLVEQPPCKRQVVGAEPTHGSMRRKQGKMLAFLLIFGEWSVARRVHTAPICVNYMKSARNILFAFILNLFFTVFEFFGGIFTGSFAILSDAIHDFGDAISIGIAYLLEKKSKKRPNSTYTYGYARYSILGALITTIILILGSVFIIIGAVTRLFEPTEVNHDGMIILAIIGVIINSAAVYITHGGKNLNQRSVSLHMLEDVLGWVVVLIGSIAIKITDLSIIDPAMSIAVAGFILFSSLRNFGEILDLFLEKTPRGVSVKDLKSHLRALPDVESLHHLHLWSMDGINNYATLHIVTSSKKTEELKTAIRTEMAEHGIQHVTIELEAPAEHCHDTNCKSATATVRPHHHH